MIRQMILLMGFIFFLTHCSSTPQNRAKLTAEEENQLALDTAVCNQKADDSARGFGKGSITWERKRQEIYDYCMKNKGWNLK